MLQITSPFDLKVISEIPLMDAQDVENALTKAHQLFEDSDQWIPAFDRISILERTIQIMTERVEELTQIAAHEGGKPCPPGQPGLASRGGRGNGKFAHLRAE